VQELMTAVATEGRIVPPERLVVEPILSLHDVMEQIVLTDIVVATRFHNLVCALKLDRPTISIGYADKNDALLADMGLGDFCQHIESLDVDLLIKQFTTLADKREEHEERIREANRAYEQRLAHQEALLASKLSLRSEVVHDDLSDPRCTQPSNPAVVSRGSQIKEEKVGHQRESCSAQPDTALSGQGRPTIQRQKDHVRPTRE
jgi:hypothetical protein